MENIKKKENLKDWKDWGELNKEYKYINEKLWSIKTSFAMYGGIVSIKIGDDYIPHITDKDQLEEVLEGINDLKERITKFLEDIKNSNEKEFKYTKEWLEEKISIMEYPRILLPKYEALVLARLKSLYSGKFTF